MTTDTKAIRAQMDPLAGHTPGPWHADFGETYRVKADGMNIATANFVTLLDRIPAGQVRQNARLIAAAPGMRQTIITLCDALEELRAENARLAKTVENCRHDFRIALKRAMKAEAERDEARAQVEAAFEAAAKICDHTANYYINDPDDIDSVRATAAEIRAMTPADAKAALNALKGGAARPSATEGSDD